MTSDHSIIECLDWADIARQLDSEGYAVLPGLLAADTARELALEVETRESIHHVPSAPVDPGGSELYYFGASLPAPLDNWRMTFYRHLTVMANRWNEILGVSDRYPQEFDEFVRRNQQAGQTQGQSHLSRLGPQGYASLQQRNDDEQVFPLQIVALLSEPGEDFQGGEFVMTEQRPRMQSRPMVLPLKLGDVAIISTAERPVKGANGYYRVNLKHAISRVREGERIGLELTFHDARGWDMPFV